MAKLNQFCRRTIFFDLLSSQESRSECSKCNFDEVRVTLALVKILVQVASAGRGLKALAGKIAVITPYKA
jgi:hypothetical protein